MASDYTLRDHGRYVAVQQASLYMINQRMYGGRSKTTDSLVWFDPSGSGPKNYKYKVGYKVGYLHPLLDEQSGWLQQDNSQA